MLLLGFLCNVPVFLLHIFWFSAPPFRHNLGDIAMVGTRATRYDFFLFLETVGHETVHGTRNPVAILFLLLSSWTTGTRFYHWYNVGEIPNILLLSCIKQNLWGAYSCLFRFGHDKREYYQGMEWEYREEKIEREKKNDEKKNAALTTGNHL